MTLAFVSHRAHRVLRELKNTKTNGAIIYGFQGSLKSLKGSPDQASSGRPALQGFLSDLATPSNVFFSEPSEDSRARRARARDMLKAER
jgi:hypothetical protein